jgi:catechol 2,3-dioxygenase-like lactoylglutathione lyase family enzyme
MIDHIELRTRDLPGTVRFYAAVLEPLGYRQTIDGVAKGFSDQLGPDFFLIQGDPADHVHYAFRAPSRDVVRACYEKASALRAADRPPALAPHIHPNYFAAYVRDPDGRLVEFTCHEAE